MVESPGRRAESTRRGLFGRPIRVIAFLLLVELAAVGVVVVSVLAVTVSAAQVQLAVLIALLGLVHTEVATGVERVRRRVTGSSYFDLTSVWTFAAAVLLPPALAAPVIVVIYGHLWLRVWRPTRLAPHRLVFTIAAVVLAAAAAHTVLDGTGGLSRPADDVVGLGVLVLAALAYLAVNTALVAAAIALTTGRAQLVDVLGKWDDNTVEIATLSLGALTAVALLVNPWFVVLVLAPLIVLHRAVLVRQLEEAASTDGKTGLLTAVAWHARAVRELRRAQRSRVDAGVLLLDLDHFKAVNDDYGHLAGDEVLAAVATILREEVRESDLAGRFGGEEFVVLLLDLARGPAGRASMTSVAERIRARVAQLSVPVDTPDGPLTITGLSTSIGGAGYPGDATPLTAVMTTADAQLYAAKRAGRNRVHIAEVPAVPAVGPPTRRPVR